MPAFGEQLSDTDIACSSYVSQEIIGVIKLGDIIQPKDVCSWQKEIILNLIF